MNFPTFQSATLRLAEDMRSALRVVNDRWQGVDVSNNPAARMYELMNINFQVPLGGVEDLDHWRRDIQPNLPWADDHFLERVGGEPLNPGVEWRNWPWGKSAAKFRNEGEIFNHTYMERLWPRFARTTPGGRRPFPDNPRRGITWEYGDLDSLVDLLVRDPSTRQAWIPLFFPEDTGYGDGGRKPCTLGYQIIVRENRIHMWYPLRSCDLVRHFHDDCYLAVRLLLWILNRCREARSSQWGTVQPGTYSMHMTSLHVFENDRRNL